jgi:hypothetical protein
VSLDTYPLKNAIRTFHCITLSARQAQAGRRLDDHINIRGRDHAGVASLIIAESLIIGFRVE